MQILVVGSGGREHALIWKLLQSSSVTQIYCAPGNAGIRLSPRCQVLPLAATDIEGLLRFATVQNIGLTVVGPEAPLVQGIGDRFQEACLPLFGPTAAAAQLEGSKSWAKQLMRQAKVPTAAAAIFTELDPALAYLRAQPLPVVIKADGLASGKGVTVAQTLEAAEEAVRSLLTGQLGLAGKMVLIEEYLIGQEVSVMALSDGQTCLPLLAAQDHKRLGTGDTGPNTGGMGAYAPVEHLVSADLMARIRQEVFEPTLAALNERGIRYQGVLYAGLMIGPTGTLSVLEFNCRLGDPEAQVLLPLLNTPLDQLLLACVEGRLAQVSLDWQVGAAACVVVASRGYPEAPELGKPIAGLEEAAASGALVFHAGTRWARASNQILTDGGRVISVTGRGRSLQQALDQAYAGVQQIHFEGSYHRPDIGHRALQGADGL